MDEFAEAPALEALAAELLSHYHLPAAGAGRITYMWRRKGGSSGGALTFGKCQKPSGLLAHFAATDFIIWLAADHLDKGNATYRQVRALLFHELSHIEEDGREGHDGEYLIVAHDFEGFVNEATSFGFWSEGLRLAAAAVRQFEEYSQLPLDFDQNGESEDGQVSR
jgi:hypothetical protein